MLSKLSLSLVLASILALAGCPGHGPAPATPDTELGEHPADRIAAARHLPHAVPLFAVTDNLSALLSRAGRGEWMARLRKRYEELAFTLVREVGYNLTSPEALADLGIDVEGQAGFALFAERSADERVVVFFSLANQERFKNLAYMIATGKVGNRRMSLHVARDGVVVGRRDLAIVILGALGMVVSGTDAMRVGRSLAELQPEESLAAHRPFRVAMRAVAPNEPLRGYVDARAALYQQAGLDPRWAGTSTEEAQRDLERLHRATLAGARSRGLSMDAIVAIDRRYVQARARLSDGPYARRVRSLFGGVGGGGFGLDVSPTGFALKAELELAPKSLLARLLTTRERPLPLIYGLGEVPALMASAHLELASVAKLARALEAPVEEANILVGADVERDLFALLTGEVGLAVLPPEGGLSAVESVADLRFAGLIGVANDERLDVLLTEFTARAEEGSPLVAAGPRKWKLTVEGLSPLHVELQKGYLVVASDASFAGRLARKKAPEGPQPWPLVASGPQAFSAYVEASALLGAIFQRGEAPAPTEELSRPAWHDPEVTASPAYTAKLAELNVNAAAIAALHQARKRRATHATLRAAAPLGGAALSARTTDHGLSLSLAYRTKGRSVASVLAALLEVRPGGGDGAVPHEDDAKLGALEAQRDVLFEELDAIYESDRGQGDGPTDAPVAPNEPSPKVPAPKLR